MQSYEYLYNTEAVRKTGFKKKRCLDMNMKNYNKFMCCFLIQIHLQSVECDSGYLQNYYPNRRLFCLTMPKIGSLRVYLSLVLSLSFTFSN